MGAALRPNPRYAPGQLGVEQRRRERLTQARVARPRSDLEGLRNWHDAGIAFRREQERHRAAEAALLEALARRDHLRALVTVEPEPFEPGDHLRVWRGGYDHHGIYMGNWEVMQFGRGLKDKPTSTVEMVPLAEYQQRGTAKVIAQRDQDREATLRRAHELLACPPPMLYNLVGHNCEHIARWCATGRFDSHQVNALMGASVVVGTTLALRGKEPDGLAVALFVIVSGAMIYFSDRELRAFKRHVEENGLG